MMEAIPALSINRLSNFDFIENQAFAFSQSSRPQQHIIKEGSGDGTREKLARATVKSSMVLVAWLRLLANGDSGVRGRERDESCIGAVHYQVLKISKRCTG